MKNIALGLIAGWICWSCSSDKGSGVGDASSCTPQNDKLIEIIAPAPNSQWCVGDTITLKWRATVDDFTGFRPQISYDGLTFTEIATSSVFAEGNPVSGDHCVTFDWVVPAEIDSSTQVTFRVRDYSSPSSNMRADIGPIILRKP